MVGATTADSITPVDDSSHRSSSATALRVKVLGEGASTSCYALESAEPAPMLDPEFFRSWVYVVAASKTDNRKKLSSEEAANLRVDKLASGSFHSKMRRSPTGTSTSTAAGSTSYRSILTRFILSSFSAKPSIPTATTTTRSSLTSLSTVPSLQARSLLSGHVSGDSTIRIGNTHYNEPIPRPVISISRQTTPTRRALRSSRKKTAAAMKSLGVFDFPGGGNSSTTKRKTLGATVKKSLLKGVATTKTTTKKIGAATMKKSLGVFDFPTTTNKKLLTGKQRHITLRRNSSPAAVKNLGRFNFDMNSEIVAMHPKPASCRSLPSNVSVTASDNCNVIVKNVQAEMTLELEYWQEVMVKQESLLLSPANARSTPQVIQTKLILGNTYLKWGHYTMAINLFASLLETLHKDQSLVAACVLEKMGCAVAYNPTNDSNKKYRAKALACITSALQIRHEKLTAFHVDTVETMNVLAGLYRKWEDYENACGCYYEVLVLRQAIFGSDHPAVAVAAHKLGQTHAQLHNLDKARNYYRMALNICDDGEIPATNPCVIAIQQDVRALEE